MKKLKFNFNELKVESFITTDSKALLTDTIIDNQLKTLPTEDLTCNIECNRTQECTLPPGCSLTYGDGC